MEDDIDWAGVLQRHALSELQQDVIEGLRDDAEPTWLLAQSCMVDRSRVEAALVDLEARSLVWHVREDSYNPDSDDELEDWWAITDTGWTALGLIKRPWYNHGAKPPG